MNRTVLKLVFWDSEERRKKTFTVSDPLEDLTQTEIEAAMQAMIGVLVPDTAQVDEALYENLTTNEIMNLIEQ